MHTTHTLSLPLSQPASQHTLFATHTRHSSPARTQTNHEPSAADCTASSLASVCVCLCVDGWLHGWTAVARVLMLLSPAAHRQEALQLLGVEVRQTADTSAARPTAAAAVAVVHCPFPSPGNSVAAFPLSVAERVHAWLCGIDEAAAKEWAVSVRPLFPLSRSFGLQSAHTNGGDSAAGEAEGSSRQQANGTVHS